MLRNCSGERNPALGLSYSHFTNAWIACLHISSFILVCPRFIQTESRNQYILRRLQRAAPSIENQNRLEMKTDSMPPHGINTTGDIYKYHSPLLNTSHSSKGEKWRKIFYFGSILPLRFAWALRYYYFPSLWHNRKERRRAMNYITSF